jgi:hypothetical protein
VLAHGSALTVGEQGLAGTPSRLEPRRRMGDGVRARWPPAGASLSEEGRGSRDVAVRNIGCALHCHRPPLRAGEVRRSMGDLESETRVDAR